MEKIICYTDGGARGNPGPAGVGVVIQDAAGNVLDEFNQFIGNGTNNFAEYQAVILCLSELKKRLGKASKITEVEVCLDSELVKKQLSAEYQIKDPGLVPLFIEIHNLRVSAFPHVTFVHVPRTENKEADRLANEAMDRAR